MFAEDDINSSRTKIKYIYTVKLNILYIIMITIILVVFYNWKSSKSTKYFSGGKLASCNTYNNIEDFVKLYTRNALH